MWNDHIVICSEILKKSTAAVVSGSFAFACIMLL